MQSGNICRSVIHMDTILTQQVGPHVVLTFEQRNIRKLQCCRSTTRGIADKLYVVCLRAATSDCSPISRMNCDRNDRWRQRNIRGKANGNAKRVLAALQIQCFTDRCITLSLNAQYAGIGGVIAG